MIHIYIYILDYLYLYNIINKKMFLFLSGNFVIKHKLNIIIIIKINTYLISLRQSDESFFSYLYKRDIDKVKNAIHCSHTYSPEFHEIHDAFSTTLRTKRYSTIHDIKLPPHPLILRGRFNPIDFKSCAQRNAVNCEGAAKRTFRNIEIKWSIAGHLMNYLCTKLNLGDST